MFLIDTENPRFRSWLRTAQYALLTVLVVVGTIILVLAGQGYDFNRSTGEVIQNGLMLVNTRPENAVVTINGEAEPDQTPGRFPLPAGDYEVGLNLDGYRPWSKKVSVSANSVEWVYYPLLIPTELEPERVTVWRNLSFISQSFNPRRVLVRQANKEPVFSLLQIDGAAVSDEQTLELPADVANPSGGTVGTFAAVEWSGNSRYVLLTHQLGESIQFIRLDTEQPDESLNLSELFDLNLTEARFIDSNPNQLYAVANRDLRRLDVNQRTISTPLAREVAAYELMRDQFLTYLASAGGQLQLELIDGNQQARLLESDLDGAASRYRISVGEFDRQFHVGLLDTRTDEVKIWRDPQANQTDQLPYVRFNAPGASELSFSRNGQFVLAQGGGSFATYDLDRDREYHFETPFSKTSDRLAEWLDGYRLLGFNKSGLMHAFEFDGANVQPLVAADPAFSLFFAADFNGFYSLSPPTQAANKFLMYTSLVAEVN